MTTAETRAEQVFNGFKNFGAGVFSIIFGSFAKLKWNFLLLDKFKPYTFGTALVTNIILFYSKLYRYLAAKNRHAGLLGGLLQTTAILGLTGVAIVGSILSILAIAAVAPPLFLTAVGLETLCNAGLLIHNIVKIASSKTTDPNRATYKENIKHHAIGTGAGLVAIVAIAVLLASKAGAVVAFKVGTTNITYNLAVGTGSSVVLGGVGIFGTIMQIRGQGKAPAPQPFKKALLQPSPALEEGERAKDSPSRSPSVRPSLSHSSSVGSNLEEGAAPDMMAVSAASIGRQTSEENAEEIQPLLPVIMSNSKTDIDWRQHREDFINNPDVTAAAAKAALDQAIANKINLLKSEINTTGGDKLTFLGGMKALIGSSHSTFTVNGWWNNEKRQDKIKALGWLQSYLENNCLSLRLRKEATQHEVTVKSIEEMKKYLPGGTFQSWGKTIGDVEDIFIMAEAYEARFKETESHEVSEFRVERARVLQIS